MLIKLSFLILNIVAIAFGFVSVLPSHLRHPTMPKSVQLKNIGLSSITQKVDHFNPSDARTFEMIYASDDQYFNSDGPIFVAITAEAGYPWELVFSHMNELAVEFGAHMVAVETRFTGLSWPSRNLSIEGLQYFTHEQILEDFAEIIRNLKAEPRFSGSKVVVFGCVLPGNIATWFRLKYPDLVDGVVASSAPVNVKPDFREFAADLSELITLQEDKECSDAVHAGFLEAQDLAANNETTRFMEAFRLCDPQSFQFEDITSFFHGYYSAYAYVIYFDGCNIIKEAPGTPLDKIVEFLVRIFFPQDECLPSVQFQQLVDALHEDSVGAYLARPTYYLLCTQIGLFTVSDSKDLIFGDSMTLPFYLEHLCPKAIDESLFGDTVVESIAATNQRYGGLKPDVTNVLSVHGGISALRHIGITDDLNPDSPALIIEGADTCADYYSSTEGESEALVLGRQKIKEQVAKWIQ